MIARAVVRAVVGIMSAVTLALLFLIDERLDGGRDE